MVLVREVRTRQEESRREVEGSKGVLGHFVLKRADDVLIDDQGRSTTRDEKKPTIQRDEMGSRS